MITENWVQIQLEAESEGGALKWRWKVWSRRERDGTFGVGEKGGFFDGDRLVPLKFKS